MADQSAQLQTPLHTPHQSQSSSRSHTPVGQALSLHEYRRQQATPPSPASVVGGERRLKRRRAASGLNSLRKASMSSMVQTYPDSAGAHQPLLSSRNVAGPTSFFSHIPPPSFVSSSPSLRHHATRSRTPSLLSSPYQPDDNRPGDKSRNFNPIKHLPRRQPSQTEHIFATVSFALSDSAQDSFAQTSDNRPSTSSPTVSLSRFPEPPSKQIEPGLPVTSAPSHAHHQRPKHQNKRETVAPLLLPPIASPIEPPRSAPPTVLHYRGASFDLVNPHRSLNLSTIETPDPRHSDQVDYFQATPARAAALPFVMPYQHNDGIELQDRPTPPRMLYNDLSTAHEAIATRSLRSAKSLESLREAYRRPSVDEPPLPSLTGYQTRMTALPQHEPLPNFSKPIRSISVRGRLSRAWRRGMDSFRTMDHAVAAQGGDIATIEEQRAMAAVPELSPSQPALRSSHVEGSTHARSLKRVSASMGNLNNARHEYDAESRYPSSSYFPDDVESVGYPPSIIDSRRSIPFGLRTGQTDYSDSVGDIHSYAFEFANRDSSHLSSPVHIRDSRLSSNKDSTIGNILDRYREVNDSNMSFGQLTDEEDDDVVRLSAMDLHQAPTVQASTTTLATRISSNQSSTAPSPKTPDAYAFPPQYVFSTSDAPPPLHPPPQMVHNFPPFAPRFTYNPSGLSDMTSGDTYGDTRELLMQSQAFSGGLAPIRSMGPWAETAAASSEAPAGVDEEEAGASPDTILRASPRSSQHPMSPLQAVSESSSASRFAGTMTPIERNIDRPATALSHGIYTTPLEYGRGYHDVREMPQTPMTALHDNDSTISPQIETARRANLTLSPSSQRSSGVPRTWSGTPPRMQALRQDKNLRNLDADSLGADSYADTEDGDDFHNTEADENDADWETVAGESRQTLAQHTMSSMAGYTDASIVASRPMFHALTRDDLHNRSSSRYSTDPLGGSATTTTPVLPLFTSTNQTIPVISQGPVNYNSSPTSEEQVRSLPFSSPKTVQTDPQLPLAVYGDDMATRSGIVHKQHEFEDYQRSTSSPNASSSDPQQVRSWTTEQFLNTGGLHTISQLLSSGPNDDILYNSSSSLNKPSTSNPLQHEDSFSKFTLLGPKANLTGTPQGTGMREVGSSLANTSSPPEQVWSSTPIRPFTSSPPVGTPDTVAETDQNTFEATDISPSMRIKARPVDLAHQSYKSTKSPQQPTITISSPSSSSKLAKSPVLEQAKAFALTTRPSREHIETGNLGDLREQRRREREERELARARAKTAKRASVPGQTELREIQLVRDNQNSPTERTAPSPVGSHYTSLSHDAHAQHQQHRKGSVTPASTTYKSNFATHTDGGPTAGRDSSDPGSPLSGTASVARNDAATEHLRRQASALDQHLLNVPPAPLTHDLVARQKSISWVLFGCAALLPPLLILYRWEVDPVVCWMTDGKVLQASQGPKRLAPWIGAGLCASILIAAVVVVVLWQVGIIL